MTPTQAALHGRRRVGAGPLNTAPSPLRGPARSAPPAGFMPCSLVAGALLGAVILGPLATAGPFAQAAPLLAYGTLLLIVRRALVRTYPHPTYGACNVVTHLRATGVAGLTALLASAASPMGGWLVPLVAGVVLALDGVDGWLARREGRCSDFGARFDMETDAALAMLLTVMVWQGGIAGVWVLWLGLARYAFVGAGRVWPWLRAPLPPRLRRKAGCVVQVAALVLALVPGMPPVATQVALAVAALLLVWSFGADVALLARTRHGQAAQGQSRRRAAPRTTGRAA